MRTVSLALLGICAALAAPDRRPPGTAPALVSPLDASAVSIGAPNLGKLQGGARLADTSYLRTLPFYVPSQARWGLPSLVGMLDRSARQVAERYRGSVLGVGDLSLMRGGDLARHHSHESGRDADVGYYLRDRSGKAVSFDRFVTVLPDGTARGRPGVVFDDARNWALLQALLEDRGGRVAQIFVAPHIRARLLRYAERSSVRQALRERAAECMIQPRGVPAHDDHFHVRVMCPRGEERTCVEFAVLPLPRRSAENLAIRRRSGSPATVRAQDAKGVDLARRHEATH